MDSISKIVPILKAVETNKVNESLVKSIRKLLDYAESGELQSFIGAGFNADGSLRFTTWADYHHDIWAMLGSIEWLKAQYIHDHHIIR